MCRDLIELLSAFHRLGVKYLIIGGYDVSFHAQPRATKDIDLFIEASDENAQRVFRALAELGAPLSGFSPADFAEAGPFFRVGREPYAVDVLTQVPGVEFATAWERRVDGPVDR